MSTNQFSFIRLVNGSIKLIRVILILGLVGGTVFLPKHLTPFDVSESLEIQKAESKIESMVNLPRKSHQIVIQKSEGDTLLSVNLIRDTQLYSQKWDTLRQVKFWQMLMAVSPDTSVINSASNREIFGKIPTNKWDFWSRRRQNVFKDSVKYARELPSDAVLYITSGRNHFYRFEPMIPQISRAIPIFDEEQVDPWYAQAILLIESPNKISRSTAGAHGAFQLMKSVAREMGLKVNKWQDERKDFDRSAWAAARFLKRTCIVETKKLLDRYQVQYDESDLWFKLLVLHVYHAGARNVGGVLRKINPTQGSKKLITEIWKTSHRRFGNASQNYTQIVLAALLEFDHVLIQDYSWEFENINAL